eukprot:TRINITY_DN2424_c0_g1_i1.p1 TRINITY_DN2424_c0_g1~~TRINITY_DN2424_c0_g1_i1.p1  ORF type:complete len:1244 (+),score=347.38 TRINITY_DN2424_c0_g1_i1:71-3802(+)
MSRSRTSKRKRNSDNRRSKRRKHDTTSSVSESEDDHLYDVVMNNSVTYAVDAWIASYKKDQNAATLQLVNFFIKCCGCEEEFEIEDFETFNRGNLKKHEKIIDSLHGADVVKEGGQYPLISRKKVMKNVVSVMLDFWKRLITACQSEIIYDFYLLKTIHDWLVAFSMSEVRAFRHTATKVYLAMGGSILLIRTRVQQQVSISKRQRDVEKNKGSRGDKDKLKELKRKIVNGKKNSAILNDAMDNLFTDVFERRYRDVRPEIRAVCIDELGEWIINHPHKFVDNLYLKYLGWALSDPASSVRSSAIKTLTKVYSIPTYYPRLDQFTYYYKERMLQLNQDIDIDVATEALKLCHSLVKCDILSHEEKYSLFSLISDYNGKIRYAAAEFLNEFLLEGQVRERFEKEIYPQENSYDSLPGYQYKALIELLQTTAHSNMPDYVVDSLWGYTSLTKNWKKMSDFLLEASKEQFIDDSEQILLARMINACVKRACGESIVPKIRGDPNHKDKEDTIEKQKDEMTTVFMEDLPGLFEHFSGMSQVVVELLEIPRYFNLDIVPKEYFELVTQNIKDSFLSGTFKYVFDEASRTLEYMSSQDQHSGAKATRKELIDSSYKSFRFAAAELIKMSVTSESEPEYPVALELAICRLNSINTKIDIFKTVAHDYFRNIMEIADMIDHGKRENTVILQNMVSALYYQLLWALHRLDKEEPKEEDINALAANKNSFFVFMERLLEDKVDIELQDFVFNNLTDSLISFSPRFKGTSLNRIAHEPSEILKARLIRYFKDEIEQIAQNILKKESKKTSFADLNTTLSQMSQLSQGDTGTSEIEDENVVKMEELVTGYGKLIIYGVFGNDIKRHASDILSNFVEYGKSYGEICKSFLNQLRRNKKDDYDVMFYTLKKKFEYLNEEDDEDEGTRFSYDKTKSDSEESSESDEESKSKETSKKAKKDKKKPVDKLLELDNKYEKLTLLAKRLAASYGIAGAQSTETRNNLAYLVSNAVNWVKSKYEERKHILQFGMQPFLGKMDKLVAQTVLVEFERIAEELELEEDDVDNSIVTYLNSLQKIARSGKNYTTRRKKKNEKKPKEPAVKILDQVYKEPIYSSQGSQGSQGSSDKLFMDSQGSSQGSQNLFSDDTPPSGENLFHNSNDSVSGEADFNLEFPGFDSQPSEDSQGSKKDDSPKKRKSETSLDEESPAKKRKLKEPTSSPSRKRKSEEDIGSPPKRKKSDDGSEENSSEEDVNFVPSQHF